jgi:hypothetical protein
VITRVRAEALPDGALLEQYRQSGAYTDCFVIEVDGDVAQSEFVCAFYTSWLFKVERYILTWAVNKLSNDTEAKALAQEHADRFAAWSVEARTAHQLLMCDYQQRTRSWLMTAPLDGGRRTRLYFGTAVAPLRPNGQKDRAFGMAFHLLVGFHKIYARALLRAAAANLPAYIASKPSA